ncbi:MAG: DUF3450 domain-containing protein, partial [Proteobacteria bacterium]|nr:DUF3450 domain-containing protein [Pseudomonadota bacterium]
MRFTTMALFFMALHGLLWLSPCPATETDQIRKPVAESIRIRQETQEQEQRWRDDKEKQLARYDYLQETKKQLSKRRSELEDKANGTESRIAAKQKQLEDIEAIQKDITPLIDDLIKEFESFVMGDLPFLAEERRIRLQRLVELCDDPEVAVSE